MFVAKGEALLQEKAYVEAALEFRNALQRQESNVEAWYGLSQAEEKQGNWNKSLEALLRLVEYDPQHLDALLALSRLLLASGHFKEALDMANRAQAVAPDHPYVSSLLSVALFKSGDKGEAIAQAEKALRMDPTLAGALMTMAAERLAASDPAQALEFLRPGFEKHIHSIPFQLMRVEALELLGEDNAAEAILFELHGQHPDTSIALENLVRFYLERDKRQDAERVLRGAVTRNPKDNTTKLNLIRYLVVSRGSEAAEAELERFVADDPKNVRLKFALAQFYRSNENTQGAIDVYEGIVGVEKSSEHGMAARVQLARLLLKTGHPEAAKKLIGEVLAVNPENIQAQLVLAELTLQEGDVSSAIDGLHRVIKHKPHSPSANILLARAHELSDNHEIARHYFESAVRAAPSEAEVVFAYARFLVDRGHLQRAEKVLSDLLARSPTDAQVQSTLAQVRIALKDWGGAQQIAGEMKESGSEPHDANLVEGLALEGLKRYEESIAAFIRAHEADPESMQPIMGIVRSYERAGKPDEGGRFLRLVLDSDPDNYPALVVLGQVYADEGRMKEGESLLRRAIAAQPTEVAAYQHLALTLARQERFQHAMETVRRGLNVADNELALRLTVAHLHELQGGYDEAINEYELIVADYPSADIAANNLASLLSDHRGDDESLAKALQLSQRFHGSSDPRYQDTLGWIYHRIGKTEKAIDLLKKAVSGEPNLPMLRYHLGMSYLAAGQQEEARQELEIALETGSTLADSEAELIKHALERLEM